MDNCIFCKIVAGQIPSYKIYENDKFLAFLDIFPSTEGYTLVIPKKHYRWVWDVENIGGYFEFVQKVVNHYRDVAGHASVYSMILGEEVPHAHVRIFPGDDKEHSKKIAEFIKNTKSESPMAEVKAKEIREKYKMQK